MTIVKVIINVMAHVKVGRDLVSCDASLCPVCKHGAPRSPAAGGRDAECRPTLCDGAARSFSVVLLKRARKNKLLLQKPA